MKKILALILVAVLCLAMGTMAFAADPDPTTVDPSASADPSGGTAPAGFTITIENNDDAISIEGKTYKAYKVFSLTLGETKDADGNTATAYAYSIKNTDWAWNTLVNGAQIDSVSGIITTKYGITLTPSANDSTDYSIDGTAMDADDARDLADALTAVLPSTADGTGTGAADSTGAANEIATITLSEPGYYAVYGVVIPTDPKADPAEEVVAALALTTTDPNATVEPKAGVPTLDKQITGKHVLDEAGKAATAEVGTTVDFVIYSIVPDVTGYTDYTFIISDTMTSGLTFTDPEGDATNDIVVTIDETELTANERTIAVNGQTFTVTIPFTTLKAATKGADIVVTYSAVVNASALTTDYEKNTASLEYSNNPKNSDTNKTPDKEVYVIDVDINVNKIDGKTTATLDGAEFQVFKGATQPADDALAWYKWDATNNKVTWVAKAEADTFTTNTNGKFDPSVQGLEAEATGTAYGLLETAAPAGYNTLAAPVIVTLTAEYTEGAAPKATITADGADVTNGTVNLGDAQNSNQPLATATVQNNSGPELPSTGGIGTTIFYIVGGILVLGAGVVLLTRKRASSEG